MKSGWQWLDTAALMGLASLEVRARVASREIRAGLHRSPAKGFSAEFADYRAYAPGDDLRHLDWKILARRDRAYLRRYEHESLRPVHLLLDRSRSMDFGTKGWTKLELAKTLTATLAAFFLDQGDAVGVTTFGDGGSQTEPPGRRRDQLTRVLAMIDRAGADPGGADTLADIPVGRRPGLLVVCSDFWDEAGELAHWLPAWRAVGHEVALLRLLDPQEIEPDFESVQLQDLETGGEVYYSSSESGQQYRAAFEHHAAALMTQAHHQAALWMTFPTDAPLGSSLLQFVRQLQANRTAGGRG